MEGLNDRKKQNQNNPGEDGISPGVGSSPSSVFSLKKFSEVGRSCVCSPGFPQQLWVCLSSNLGPLRPREPRVYIIEVPGKMRQLVQ